MSATFHVSPPPISSQAMADLLSTIVLFCRGKDEYKRDFWAYLCIKPSMAESFKKAQEDGTMVLGDYGTIIEAGEGSEAPKETKERMGRDYGVRENFEAQILEAIAKHKYA